MADLTAILSKAYGAKAKKKGEEEAAAIRMVRTPDRLRPNRNGIAQK
jgi:hypothetical protein